MAQRKKSILDGFLYLLNIVVALALAGSYLAYYFDPQFISFFSFLALAYPALLLLNLIFVLYWVLRLKVKLALSVLIIALGYQHLPRLYQWRGTNVVVSSEESLKTMSYNLRMFNRFNWIDDPAVPQKIADYIHVVKPAVLAVQEYHQYEKTPQFDFAHRYLELENAKNGLGIFSQHPILERGRIEFGNLPDGRHAGYAIFADLDWNGKTLRFINVHLASVRFGPDEYQRLGNPGGGDQESIKRDFTKIYQNLRSGFQMRSHQIALLEKEIEKSPHPVVLCGDFNDTPHSYSYGRIQRKLKDSFVEAGEGMVRSFNRGPLPLRIDYIFHDKSLRSVRFGVSKNELSDHEAIFTELGWR